MDILSTRWLNTEWSVTCSLGRNGYAFCFQLCVIITATLDWLHGLFDVTSQDAIYPHPCFKILYIVWRRYVTGRCGSSPADVGYTVLLEYLNEGNQPSPQYSWGIHSMRAHLGPQVINFLHPHQSFPYKTVSVPAGMLKNRGTNVRM